MAIDAVDVSVSGLTRVQFKRLKKDQLIALAEEEDVPLERDMTKPVIATFLTDVLQLEQMWSEQEREKEMELQQQGKEREQVHLEKLAWLEVEKAAVMGHKPGQKFDINQARSFMTSFDENVVDIFLKYLRK